MNSWDRNSGAPRGFCRLAGIGALLLLVASCGGGGRDAPGSVARLEVSPTALLLNGTGQTQALKVRAFDANDVEITNPPVTFTSSRPVQVSVSSDGIVTAANPVGSAIITVSSGSVSAPPLLVAAVETDPGSIFVSDEQVLVGPQPLPVANDDDPERYTVVVKGIAPPAPGTVMLASGSYAIAGKVISSSLGSGDAINVTLELAALDQLFRNLSVSGTLAPGQVEQLAATAASTKEKALAGNTKTEAIALSVSNSRRLPCSANFDTSLFDARLDATVTAGLPTFNYDVSVLEHTGKSLLIELTGSIDGSVTGTLIVGAVAGSVECNVDLLKIPFGGLGLGPLALFIRPDVPLGLTVRAQIDATTNVTYGLTWTLGADYTIGVKHDAAGQHVPINTVSMRTPKPEVLPTFANTAARVKLGLFAGMTAGISVGGFVADAAKFVGAKPKNFIELIAGVEMTNSWGAPYDVSQDAAFNSAYELGLKVEVGPGPGLKKLQTKIRSIAASDLTLSVGQLLGTSPTLSAIRLSKNSFRAGDSLTFRLNLDPASTVFPLGVGSYNVQEVRIYRLHHTSQSASQIASAIAAEWQSDFAIPWMADADGTVGANSDPVFYAFALPRVLSALRSEFPIELGRVDGPSIELRPAQVVLQSGDTATFDAYLDGNKAATGVTWSATGGSISALGEYTAGIVPGVYEVRATRDSTGEVAVSSVQVQAVVSPPSIASVTVSPASPIVGAQAVFSVNGADLQPGFAFVFPGCAPNEVSSASTTQRQFLCTLTQAGSNLAGSIKSLAGTILYSFNLTVSAVAIGPMQSQRLSISVDSSCALTPAGGVKCWGENSNAQIGDGSTQFRYTPTDVVGLGSGVVAVSAGGTHTCALMAAGSVKCWGVSGLLRGDGTTQFRLTPADVVELGSGVVEVSAGGDHSCALMTNGGVKCWGVNDKGQLGDGTTQNRPTPVDVVALGIGAVAVSAGPGNSCALTVAGGVKCWGNNSLGQLGDGTTQNRPTPVDVAGLSSGVLAVSVGTNHSCALTVAMGVKCWGNNATGQIGDGTTTTRLTPVDVAGLSSSVASVSAGTGGGQPHTCALTNAGGVKCWGGFNLYGELGDGTTQYSLTPVNVVGLSSGVAVISAGGGHSCALMNADGAKCWGHNNRGQLGIGRVGDRLTPVDVVGL